MIVFITHILVMKSENVSSHKEKNQFGFNLMCTKIKNTLLLCSWKQLLQVQGANWV